MILCFLLLDLVPQDSLLFLAEFLVLSGFRRQDWHSLCIQFTKSHICWRRIKNQLCNSTAAEGTSSRCRWILSRMLDAFWISWSAVFNKAAACSDLQRPNALLVGAESHFFRKRLKIFRSEFLRFAVEFETMFTMASSFTVIWLLNEGTQWCTLDFQTYK